MEPKRLKTLAEFGQALWGDPERYRRRVLETVTALALLEEDSAVGMEKGASALLARVKREGIASNTEANQAFIELPFYRLSPEERFVLVALHAGRWNYPQLARVLGQDLEQLQEFSWAARLKLAMLENHRNPSHIPYPAAPVKQGASCPEFNPSRPWAQRFMDDAIEVGADRMFLQNHLMACDSCRQHLSRCRDFYHRIEALVPKLSDADELIPVMSKAVRQSELLRDPMAMTFAESLLPMFRRVDTWIALGLVLYCLKKLLFH